MFVRVGGLLDFDSSAGVLLGPGWFIQLGWTGREWRWGRQFYASSSGQAMNSMRIGFDVLPSERLYLFRWVPHERRWGRIG